MTSKRAIIVVASLVASGMIAGCDYGVPAAASGGTAAPGNVLRCSSVVDSTGYKHGPLTTDLAVAYLTDMQLTGGGARISRGKPTAADTSTLDTTAVELMGFSGSKLSGDAEAFAQAELNYNPDGPVYTSYARPLDLAILLLQRDCPDGAQLGRQWRAGGG